MLAILRFPETNTPTQGIFKNLHGYWQPPKFVTEFWATGVIFHYTTDADYQSKCKDILNSYMGAIKLFYRDNAL